MPTILKPPSLESFLSKLKFTIINWDIDVGGPIEAAVDWLLGPINVVADWISSVIAWLEDLIQEIKDFISLAREKFNEITVFISNFFHNVGDTITEWWGGVIDTVKEWVNTAKEFVLDVVENLKKTVDKLDVAWDNFWTKTFPTLASKFDVSDMIQNAFLEWKDVLNFVSIMRAEIMEFFSNPVEFVWNQFTDWFFGG